MDKFSESPERVSPRKLIAPADPLMETLTKRTTKAASSTAPGSARSESVSEVETKPEGLPSLEEVKALLGSEGWNPSARRTGVTQGALARLESVAQELPLIFQDFRDSG